MPERSSTHDVSRLIERCLATYSNRPSGDVKLMVMEWHRHLSAFDARELHRALDVHFEHSQWWPTPADILRHVRSRIAPPQLPSYKSDDAPFARGNRTVEQEISYRSSVIARAWRDARAVNPEPPKDPAEPRDPRPASQDMTVSPYLQHSCAARRVRGHRTCSVSCTGSYKAGRNCRVDMDLGL